MRASTTCASPTTRTSPAFMDACDELGLVVMNCIPGLAVLRRGSARSRSCSTGTCASSSGATAITRAVMLWEVSLNETAMPPEFIATTHAHRARGVSRRPVLHVRMDAGLRRLHPRAAARRLSGRRGDAVRRQRVRRLGVLRDDRRARTRSRSRSLSPGEQQQPAAALARRAGDAAAGGELPGSAQRQPGRHPRSATGCG